MYILYRKVGVKYGIKTDQSDCLIFVTLEALWLVYIPPAPTFKSVRRVFIWYPFLPENTTIVSINKTNFYIIVTHCVFYEVETIILNIWLE